MKSKNSSAKKRRLSICFAAYLLIVVLLIIVATSKAGDFVAVRDRAADDPTGSSDISGTEAPTEEPTHGTSYMISGVPTIQQSGLSAGCETYACTMLLQYLGYDIDEYRFADNYLITSLTSWDENGIHYGPDMHSAMAGTAYAGFGIYAPAMAKSMNNFFQAVGSQQRATAMEGVPLDELCRTYVDRDIPVMIWATTWMDEPYVASSWVVDYVDENARAEIGDTVSWMQHEHCLVLIGYDEEYYYFADSYKGAVSHFEKELSQLRYEQIGTMSIVVQ